MVVFAAQKRRTLFMILRKKRTFCPEKYLSAIIPITGEAIHPMAIELSIKAFSVPETSRFVR